MAPARWLRGLVVMIPVGVLGVTVVADALQSPAVVVAGAFGI